MLPQNYGILQLVWSYLDYSSSASDLKKDYIMHPKRVKEVTLDLPYMTLKKGQKIYDFILKYKLSHCLELGFYHGVSSVYIGGALEELEGGSLITIDRCSALSLVPNIYSLLIESGLSKFVTPIFEPTSYTWRLMKLLEERRHESFDFCYIDAGHSWDVTGFAFFLVSKLLRPGGWIIFDDLDWTYSTSRALKNDSSVLAMPDDERTTPQVRKVFELLVKTDSRYRIAYEHGSWGFAQKAESCEP